MILVIDNYDSFTWNLVHYLEETGARTRVIRNDELSVEHALAVSPQGVVLSPGPCTPNEAGICVDLVRRAPADLPILGVCLGHQSIGQAEGGAVIAAKDVRHGKRSEIHHARGPLFN
ncbi:MAG: aminodeoxychorismate/anthranilate synthase component II, partial [Pseudomonadota bacterium]